MLKFIGALVVGAAIVLAIGSITKTIDFGGHAKLTQKGHNVVHDMRNTAADKLKDK